MPIDNYGYTKCANDNNMCKMPIGKQILAYGTNESFLFRTYNITNPNTACYFCSDQVQGDPLIGAAKYCYTKPFPSVTYTNGIPDGFPFTYSEGQNFTPTFNAEILYGADGKYNGGFQENGKIIGCRNDIFGDPAPGASKKCYVRSI